MTKEELIKEVLNMRKFNYTLTPDEVFLEILKAINTEPRKHGRWITDAARIKDQCSICHMSVNYERYQSPYCPICGAKMDEVEE